MSDSSPAETDFLNQLIAIVEKNISNEQFGVSELADEMNMSRSNLLRKVKKETELSVSQLISQIRLKKAMELLKTTSFNVSEVSHQVGFSSTSYFIKCFREYYGYPPGEAGKRVEETQPVSGNLPEQEEEKKSKSKVVIFASIGLLVALLGAALIYYLNSSANKTVLEKSIAVLPFKNDSNDSTNVYLINGLMESTLNNLQKIQDLKVISRTSSEKYRSTSKSIPEMAKELNVNYFVEGSGQKIGDRILLNIQLIEGPTDKHLWAKQYRREASDIFALQQEIAKDITEEIQAVITPEEERSINKIPTDDLVAYDLYLKGSNLWGQEIFTEEKGVNELKSVYYFKQAIKQDPDFALAYAAIAITYYYRDYFKKDPEYTNEISLYADKALLLDPKLAESLIAKAFYYMHIKEYKEAAPFFEKALEYNPNSILAINNLAEYYGRYVPDTRKYLEYALKGLRLEKSSSDSVATSYSYLHLGNALLQSGFVDEASKYIDKVIEYNNKNPYARHIKAFIHYAQGGTLEQTREMLIREFNKDTTRIDILLDIGKVSFYMEDYKTAYEYDKRLLALKEFLHLDVYTYENLRIGVTLAKLGFKKESEAAIESFKNFIDKENFVYRHLALSGYYCYRGDNKKSLELMNTFLEQEDNYVYWIVLFMDKDPTCDSMKDNPEYKKIMSAIKAKFWKNQDEVKAELVEKGLL